MSADDNMKTMEKIYEAFGRGDVGFILERLTEDVDWATDTASTAAPWYGVCRGRDAVAGFFREFGSNMSVQQFDLVSIAANDTDVHTIVKLKATRIANGRSADMNLHHWFKMQDGQVSYYRGSEDTSQVETIFAD